MSMTSCVPIKFYFHGKVKKLNRKKTPNCTQICNGLGSFQWIYLRENKLIETIVVVIKKKKKKNIKRMCLKNLTKKKAMEIVCRF